jgi:antitoxin (DNA-binding transcriptional repressor) of toxin-antitoxin stability system
MSKVINIHEAKTHLSRLIEEVLAGEEITIAKAGVPLIDLKIHTAAKHYPGCLKGLISSTDGSEVDAKDPEITAMWKPELEVRT